MAKNKKPTDRQLKRLVRSTGQEILLDPNVTSVGVGYKESEGKITKDLSITFTVAMKGQSHELEELGSKPIPKVLMIDGIEVPTDIVQRKYHPGYTVIAPEEMGNERDQRRVRQDPLMPGISVSHVAGNAGTLGCIVYDKKTGEPYVLSNWHVLHRAEGKIGDHIVQPGPYDDNQITTNQMGTLVRSHLGVAGDCALCSIENRQFNERIYDLDIIPRRIAKVDLGDKVVKSGRTTGITHGVVRRKYVTVKMNYGGELGEQMIGGFEIGPDPDIPAKDNEVSMGGDSGSVWLLKDPETGKPMDIICGLHFAGEGRGNPDEHAMACNIHTVFNKLQITLEQKQAIAKLDPEEFRKGYDPKFLGDYEIPLPMLNRKMRNESLKVGKSYVVDYVHFSLVMHNMRRMPLYAAYNTDGKRMVALPRDESWKFDERVGTENQIGESIYKDNEWLKGKLVRRTAVQWGPIRNARKARDDTYFFTNAVPQYEDFETEEWKYLENWVLDCASEEFYRLCVFSGPIFTENDPKYRGIRIPTGFWKIIGMRKRTDDTVSVTAFLVPQYPLKPDAKGRKFLDLKAYQVSLNCIEFYTGLDFSVLKDYEPEDIQLAEREIEGYDPEPFSIISGPRDIAF